MSSDNQIRAVFESVTKAINQDLDDFTPLKSICRKYDVEPAHVVLATVILLVILTLTGLFQHVFVTLFGLVYPAYMSFKAIHQQSQQKCKIWLTYWIVFGIVTAFDKLLGILLFFLPGYYVLKIIFYIWMFYPRTNGALIIYEHFLKPQLLRFKDIADKRLD